MSKVIFNDLPFAVRTRFVAMTQNAPNDPRVLLSYASSSVGLANWIVGTFAGFAALVLAASLMSTGSSREPKYDVGTYAFFGLFAAIAAACAIGIGYRAKWNRPPFKRGTYVLRTAIVKAEGGVLDILPFNQLGKPQITHFHRNGGYVASWLKFAPGFELKFRTKNEAVERAGLILATSETYMRILQARDGAALGQIDVFFECTTSGQWSYPGQPVAQPLMPSVPAAAVAARWLGSLAVGAAVAAAMFAYVDSALAQERKAFNQRLPQPQPSAPAQTSSSPPDPLAQPQPSQQLPASAQPPQPQPQSQPQQPRPQPQQRPKPKRR